jgi:hypothetical protein
MSIAEPLRPALNLTLKTPPKRVISFYFAARREILLREQFNEETRHTSWRA